MELRELRYFLQIARDHSYTEAARHMDVTQPALSKMMKKLEGELGVPLVESAQSGILLTDYGEALYERAAPLMEGFESLQDVVQQVRGAQRGRLCVGITPMLGTLFLSDIIADFCSKYPNIQLNLQENGSKRIYQQAAEGKIDLGVCIAGDHDVLLHETVLFEDSAVVCVHRDAPLAGRGSVSFADLRDESFNLYSRDAALSAQIRSRCVRAGFQPKINMMSSIVDVVVELTGRGRGICILPRPYAARCSALPLRLIPLKDELPWTGCLVRRRDGYRQYSSVLFESYVCQRFRERKLRL